MVRASDTAVRATSSTAVWAVQRKRVVPMQGASIYTPRIWTLKNAVSVTHAANNASEADQLPRLGIHVVRLTAPP